MQKFVQPQREWFGLIFEFHKSDTLRKLIYVLIIYGIYSGTFVYLELHYTNFKSTISIHSLIGICDWFTFGI